VALADVTAPAAPLRSARYALVARVLRASGRILGVLILARLYTASDVADFALAFSIASIVGLASDLGLTDHAVRVIAGATGSTVAFERRVVGLRLATLGVAMGVAWTLAYAANVPPLAAFGTVGFALVGSATETFASIRRGHRRHDLEALECAPPLAIIAVAGGVAVAGGSLAELHLVLGGGAVLFACARSSAFLARRGKTDEPLPSIRSLVSDTRWLLARSLATLALTELPILVLAQMSTRTEVAVFAVAARSVGVMMQTLAVLPLVYLPLLSRAAVVSQERLAQRTNELNLLHIVATPAAYAACILGGEVLVWMSGEAYAASRAVVMVLSLGTLLYACTLSTLPMVVLRRERIVVVASLVGIVTMIVASVPWAATHGAFAMALIAGIAFAAVKVVHVIGYRGLAIPLGDRRHVLALLVAAAILAAGSLLPRSIGYPVLFVGGVVSAAWTYRLLRVAPPE